MAGFIGDIKRIVFIAGVVEPVAADNEETLEIF